jgi:hypothetical protein
MLLRTFNGCGRKRRTLIWSIEKNERDQAARTKDKPMSETQDECSPASHCSRLVAAFQEQLRHKRDWMDRIPNPSMFDHGTVAGLDIAIRLAKKMDEEIEVMKEFQQ